MFSDVDGEVILMSLESGSYFSLNEVGSEIWQRLTDDKPIGIQVLLDELMEIFDVAADECASSTLAYIDQLVDLGIVQLAND